jgi:hypothetical protein
VIETALDQELTEHLGHEKNTPAGNEAGNVRNGSRSGSRRGGRCGCGAVAAVALKVAQEVADERCVQVGDVELAGLLPGALGGECQEQPPCCIDRQADASKDRITDALGVAESESGPGGEGDGERE